MKGCQVLPTWVVGNWTGWMDGYPLDCYHYLSKCHVNNTFVRKDRQTLPACGGISNSICGMLHFVPVIGSVHRMTFLVKTELWRPTRESWVSPTDSLLGWYEDIVWCSVKAYKWRTSLQLSNQRKSSLPERKMLSTTTSNKIMVSALILLPSLATASILPIKFNFGSSGNSFPSLKSVQQCEGHQDDALVGC